MNKISVKKFVELKYVVTLRRKNKLSNMNFNATDKFWWWRSRFV
jgi:hypothetical protein